jgi:predicted nucleic acid-binding protein
VVDASVWVSAADPSDVFCQRSRAFLTAIAQRNLPIALPAFAPLEVACALARRTRNAEGARELAARLLQLSSLEVHEVNVAFLERAGLLGTNAFLRAADALYAAVAERTAGRLVSWDGELIDRAGGMTPDAWLAHT